MQDVAGSCVILRIIDMLFMMCEQFLMGIKEV